MRGPHGGAGPRWLNPPASSTIAARAAGAAAPCRAAVTAAAA